jgi:predicted dehydrogenase
MYRIGLIGNRAHQNVYGPIWNERSDCEIVAAAEHHAEKGGALTDLYGVTVASDYDAVLEDPNVDIVSICTDFYLKRTLIEKALACGKHVLVDKAIGRTVAEAREIAAVVDGASTQVVLAYPSRFLPTILRLKQAVDQNEYGRIVAYTHNSVKQFAGDLMAYVSYPTPVVQNGGGELMNLGSHAVDSMLWMFGMPRRICCKMENAYFEEYAQFGTEDIATLWCDYDGFSATLTVGRSNAREQDAMYDCVDVTGEGVWVRLSRGGYTVNGQDIDLPDVQVTGTAGCVNHLIECIENDKPSQSSAREGLAVAQATTAAYQSAVSGEFVDLPLRDENHPAIDVNDQVIDRLLD